MSVWPQTIVEAVLPLQEEEQNKFFLRAKAATYEACRNYSLMYVDHDEILHEALIAPGVFCDRDNRSLDDLISEQIVVAIKAVLRKRSEEKQTITIYDEDAPTTGPRKNPVTERRFKEFQAEGQKENTAEDFEDEEERRHADEIRNRTADITTKQKMIRQLLSARRVDMQKNISPILDALEADPFKYIHPPNGETGVYVIREKLCPDLGISDDAYGSRIGRFETSVLAPAGLTFEALLLDMLIMAAVTSHSELEEWS